jgi:hypothetical protein
LLPTRIHKNLPCFSPIWTQPLCTITLFVQLQIICYKVLFEQTNKNDKIVIVNSKFIHQK